MLFKVFKSNKTSRTFLLAPGRRLDVEHCGKEVRRGNCSETVGAYEGMVSK